MSKILFILRKLSDYLKICLNVFTFFLLLNTFKESTIKWNSVKDIEI
jgi:hypothetical protein